MMRLYGVNVMVIGVFGVVNTEHPILGFKFFSFLFI